MQPAAADLAERVVRESYGRLLAYLAAQFRDVTSAEDALADALTEALANWPRVGIPLNPDAWLLTVARRRIIDRTRRTRTADGATERLLMSLDENGDRTDQSFPDERLKLMYVCAHPAIDEAARAPLMLQTILGLDAERIASAFVISPAAMSQRLVRAKAKIRDAGLAFKLPDEEHLAGRTAAVLDAIYATYTVGHDDARDLDAGPEGMGREAIWLARMVVGLMPDDPEAIGLLALLLFSEARREAGQLGNVRIFIPLGEQDCTRWSEPLMAEAEALLRRSGSMNRLGRFQLEAAIQAVHAARRSTGNTDWRAIHTLYQGLIALAPTLGALVSRAVVVAELEGPDAALRELDRLRPDDVAGYQPYWAVRANFLDRIKAVEEALSAYSRAIELCADPAVRAYLHDKKLRLSN